MLITPFLLGISFQMPNMAGFFGIFLFLCFHAIFSDLPVFSHVFPAILVNSSANKYSVSTGLGFCYSKQLCLFHLLKSLRSEYELKRYKGVCFAAAHPLPVHGTTLWPLFSSSIPADNHGKDRLPLSCEPADCLQGRSSAR